MEQKKGQLPTVSPLPEDQEIVDEIRAEVARLREEVYSPAQVVSGNEKEMEESGEQVMPVQSPAEVRPMADLPDIPPVLSSEEDKPEIPTPASAPREIPKPEPPQKEIPETPAPAPEIPKPEIPKMETPDEPEQEAPVKKLSRKERRELKKQNRRKQKEAAEAAKQQETETPEPLQETPEPEELYEGVQLRSFDEIKKELQEQKPEQSEPTSSFSYLYDNTQEVPLSSISHEERQREREERARNAMEEALAHDPKAQKEAAAEPKATLESELESHPTMTKEDPSIVIDGFDYQQWRRTTESLPKLTDKFLEQHAREEAAKNAGQGDLSPMFASEDPEVAEIAALMAQALSPIEETPAQNITESKQPETAEPAEHKEAPEEAETKEEASFSEQTEPAKEEPAAEPVLESKEEAPSPEQTEPAKEEPATEPVSEAKEETPSPEQPEPAKEETAAEPVPEAKEETPSPEQPEPVKEEPAAESVPEAKEEAPSPEQTEPAKEKDVPKTEAPSAPSPEEYTDIFSDTKFEEAAEAAEAEEEPAPVIPHFVPVADPERYRLNTLPLRTFRLEESNEIFQTEIARYARKAAAPAKKTGKAPSPAAPAPVKPTVPAPAPVQAESARPAEAASVKEPAPAKETSKKAKHSAYGKKVSLHPGTGGLRAAIAAAIRQAESEPQTNAAPEQEEDDSSSKPSDLSGRGEEATTRPEQEETPSEPVTKNAEKESVKEETAPESAPDTKVGAPSPEQPEPAKETAPDEKAKTKTEAVSPETKNPEASHSEESTAAKSSETKESVKPEAAEPSVKSAPPAETESKDTPQKDVQQKDIKNETVEPAEEKEKPGAAQPEAAPETDAAEALAKEASPSSVKDDASSDQKPSAPQASPSGDSGEIFSDTKFQEEAASKKAESVAEAPQEQEPVTTPEPTPEETETAQEPEKKHGFPFRFGKGKQEETAESSSDEPSLENAEKTESASGSEKTKHKKFPFAFGAADGSSAPKEKYDTKGTEEYEPDTDPKKISAELKTAIREMHIRIGVTGLFTAALLALGLICEKWIPNTVTPYPYLILNLIFLLIPAGICFKTLFNGIKALFSLQGNTDSGISVAVLTTILQGIALLFNPGMVTHYEVHLYSSIAVGMLLVNSIGKLSMLNRVSRNFIFVTSSDTKWSVEIYEDMSTAIQLAKGCVSEAPRIAYQHKNRFLKHFLRNSYAGDPSIRTSQLIAPIALVASVVLCIVTIIITGSFIVGLTALSLATCISAPIASLLCVNLPVAKLCALARRHGAMLTGYSAVEKLASTNAVMLDSTDLFPKDSVSLANFKSYSNRKIEQTVHNAAAVVSNIGGTLRDLFEGVISSQKEMLPMATDITYYEDRGMAGTVSGKRILLGNLMMMEENHIAVPRDDQAPNLNKNQSVLYLAEDSELIAMLIVAYEPDIAMIHEMQRLEHCGIAAIIRTLDPNLTAEFLSRLFLVSESALKILPAELGDICDDALQTETDESEALLATRGQPFSMMRMLSACVRQKHNISVSVTLQIVSVIIGFILVAFLSCYAGLQQLSTLAILIYEAFWLAAIVIIPKLRKP